MKGGQSKEAKAGPLAHCCRLKVIEASKCIDYDAKGAIERIAKELGAVLYQNTTKAITHFVIAEQSQVSDGDVTGLSQRIAQATRLRPGAVAPHERTSASPNAFIVSQAWVHECARVNERIPEEDYRVDAENLHVIFKKDRRRCKSTVPASVDDVNLDLTAPFFSSTQVLGQADCEPMARKQTLKNCRPQSALERKPRHTEPHTFSPATSVSKDDELSQEHARMLYSDNQPTAQNHSRKTVCFSVERLPSKRRNTVHGHVPRTHSCSPPMSRRTGLQVDFQLPLNISPGSAVKARTRNRTPSLDFMLARIGMPLPIIRDEGRALKRNDALFLAAANASRANAPKSEIPVPVVRPVAEEGITQQSCPNNRPRRRKMAVDPVQLVQDAPNARAAKTPHEALAMGIWTEHREWDYLPPYRACVTTVRDQKRSLTECMSPHAAASPKAAATPTGGMSSGLVVPDSTCPTDAAQEATVKASAANQSRQPSAAVRNESDMSAQENISAPVGDKLAAERGLERQSAGGLFSCLAALGHNTRHRLSALAAVVAAPSDGCGQVDLDEADPDPMPSAAACVQRDSSAQPAQKRPAHVRKHSIAVRELGIDGAVEDLSNSGEATATHATARRTRACSTVPPLLEDTATVQPKVNATRSKLQSREQSPCAFMEPGSVPRAKRSPRRGASERPRKRPMHDSSETRSTKRMRASTKDATAARDAVPNLAAHDADAVDRAASDTDMPKPRVYKRFRFVNQITPRTPRPRPASVKRRIGVISDFNIGTDELPLALRAACMQATLATPVQLKIPEKGKGRRAQSLGAVTTVRSPGKIDGPICVACSGVSQEVIERCRRAVKRLGNATMIDTEEEAMKSKLTHLVLGSFKRSGKLLLALASNAVVVRPEWLVQSIRWRRWVPTPDFMFEFGPHMENGRQISQRIHPSLDKLLASHKVHVTSAVAKPKKDCVRVQLCRQLVALLGGAQASAGRCDVCVLVSPDAQKKDRNSAKQIRTERAPRGACRNQVDVRTLGLSQNAVVVADSWLKSTVETRKKQAYKEHLF